MAQLWKGRFKKELAKETNDFNSSIKFDCRMFEEDIKGSIAHATMLGATGIRVSQLLSILLVLAGIAVIVWRVLAERKSKEAKL